MNVIVLQLIKPTPTALQAESLSNSKNKQKHNSKRSSADLEKLRKERKRREEVEKVRTEALLRKHYGLAQDKDGSSSGHEPVPARK